MDEGGARAVSKTVQSIVRLRQAVPFLCMMYELEFKELMVDSWII